ncbi:MAG: OadG family protein [Clostridia bacterium]|nr:OadG family protein [Clostridia bacterium]
MQNLLFQSLGNSVLGLAIVFAVLIILMACIKVMSAFMKKGEAPQKVQAPASAAPVVAAKGSCGDIRIFDVPEKTAAMLMAITADKLGEPLHTLRFISIKEVK